MLADTTQLQSALINIALIARDAMPDGGRIFLRSEAVTIDDTYMAQELDVAEGSYVRLSISDTGRGRGRIRVSGRSSRSSQPNPSGMARA